MSAYTLDDLPDVLTGRLRDAICEAAPISQTEMTSRKSVAAATEEGFVDSVSLDEALELYTVVRDLRPSVTIEIGMFTGASTLAILAALDTAGQGEHHACDPFQDTYASNAGLRNIEMAGLGHRLTFANDFPENASVAWPVADFAFIDGSHLFDLTMVDFVVVDKHLKCGGLVGLHDMHMPALQKIVRWWVTNRGYEFVAASQPPSSRGEYILSWVAAFLRLTPRAAAIWAPELLRPWHELAPPRNMIFLRKTRGDERNWSDYTPF